jgi:hypothetical protein
LPALRGLIVALLALPDRPKPDEELTIEEQLALVQTQLDAERKVQTALLQTREGQELRCGS